MIPKKVPYVSDDERHRLRNGDWYADVIESHEGATRTAGLIRARSLSGLQKHAKACRDAGARIDTTACRQIGSGEDAHSEQWRKYI